jgi:hypothetical protein
MIERFRTPGVARAVLWASALVLIAGVVAFVTVRVGSNDDSSPAASPGSVPTGYASEDYDPTATVKAPKESDVPRAARVAAGEFVLAAVGREDLQKAWKLTDPDLKKACGCTYEQWLTGNIPVQYFPTKGLEGAAFSVNEVSKGHVILEVLLTPAKDNKDGLAPTAFYIGLKQRGGDTARWLVDYWAPVDTVAVPAAPNG